MNQNFTTCAFDNSFNCIRLNDLFNSFDDMIIIFDEKGNILKENKLTLEKLEYSEHELSRMTIFDIRHPKYKKDLNIKLKEIFDGKTNVCEIPFMTKTGKELPVSSKIHLGELKFKGDRIAYSFCKDLREIRNYEEKLNKIFSSSAYSASITSLTDGKFVDVNKRFEETVGYKKEDVVGKTSVELNILTEENKNALVETLKKNGTLKNLELPYLTKSNEIRLGEFSGDYVKIDGDDYLMLFVADITDKKENIDNYMSLLKAIPYLMVRIRKDGLILDIKPGDDKYLNSSELKNYIGYEVYSLPIEDYIKYEMLKNMENVIETGNINEHQCYMNILGSKRYFHTRTVRNGLDEVILIIRDITEEINIEQDLRRSKDYAEKLIEMSNAIFVELDINGKILKFNETAERITGWKKDEVINKNWFDIMIPKEKKHEMLMFLNKIKFSFNDEHKKHENEIITKNGEIRYIVWRNNFIKNSQGINIVSFGMDMTERKKFEEELLIAKEKAENSDKMKLEFLANMSHDLRTPMNAIIGFSDLLKANNISKTERIEYINTIMNNGKFLMTLIDDIIDVSKIDTGSLRIEKRDFEINKLLEELRLSYVKQTKDKNINIMIEEDVNKNIIINTDKYRMRQILMNLIGNSIKFTKEGYVKFGYNIIDDKKLEIFVEDTGVGIAKENQKTIFERFKQLNNTGHKFKGAGLGLSITRSLIDLLGFDEIKLISDLGKGSRFYFQVPYTIKKFDYISDLREKEYKKINDLNLKGKTILIVEDDKDSRYIISKHLFKTGVGIIECDNGNLVLDILKSKKIDLVLLDIGLPGKSGYKLIKEIKEYDSRIPIIVESALAMPDQKVKAFDLGCDDYVTKPFSAFDLIDRIDKLI